MSSCGCVPDSDYLDAPVMLRQGNLLTCPCLGCFIFKFTFGDGPQFIAKVRVGSKESCVGVFDHGTVRAGEEHEGGSGFCAEGGRVDGVFEGLGHCLFIVDRVADRES